MGTRGVCGWFKNGITKVSYNHFDSYPEGLGRDIVSYATDRTLQQLNEDFEAVSLVEQSDTPSEEAIATCVALNLYSDNMGRQSPGDWYCLLYEAQGNLKAYAQVGYMIDSKNFIKDSLFCEWGYIINLDTNTLEVYEGFQKANSESRYSLQKPSDSGYWACKLIYECPLATLPGSFEEFIKKEANGNSEVP